MWDASITTPTPSGDNTSSIAAAMSLVIRSWTWSLREKTSTIRASLLNPIIFLFGKYPIVTRPKKGTKWCSHILNISISLTMTISSWFSLKTASLITSAFKKESIFINLLGHFKKKMNLFRGSFDSFLKFLTFFLANLCFSSFERTENLNSFKNHFTVLDNLNKFKLNIFFKIIEL